MNISSIKKYYNNKTILDDVSFTLQEGELLVILGKSGSGKSTLLKIIAGIETADSGKIISGEDEVFNIPMEKRNIGYIFQEPLLFPHMNVYDNVHFGLKMRKVSKADSQKTVMKYLTLLQVDDCTNKMPHQLSGGQKQRVAIARSLVCTPKVLLMDEPFASLDHNLRLDMGRMIKQLKEELGLTIIFVTHDIEESMLLGDRIAFLDEGKLLEIAPPRQLYYNPVHEQSARFMGLYNRIGGSMTSEGLITKYGCINEKYAPSTERIFVRPNMIKALKDENGAYIVDAIEWRGKDVYITLKGEELIILGDISSNLRSGDTVRVEISSSHGDNHQDRYLPS